MNSCLDAAYFAALGFSPIPASGGVTRAEFSSDTHGKSSVKIAFTGMSFTVDIVRVDHGGCKLKWQDEFNPAVADDISRFENVIINACGIELPFALRFSRAYLSASGFNRVQGRFPAIYTTRIRTNDAFHGSSIYDIIVTFPGSRYAPANVIVLRNGDVMESGESSSIYHFAAVMARLGLTMRAITLPNPDEFKPPEPPPAGRRMSGINPQCCPVGGGCTCCCNPTPSVIRVAFMADAVNNAEAVAWRDVTFGYAGVAGVAGVAPCPAVPGCASMPLPPFDGVPMRPAAHVAPGHTPINCDGLRRSGFLPVTTNADDGLTRMYYRMALPKGYAVLLAQMPADGGRVARTYNLYFIGDNSDFNPYTRNNKGGKRYAFAKANVGSFEDLQDAIAGAIVGQYSSFSLTDSFMLNWRRSTPAPTGSTLNPHPVLPATSVPGMPGQPDGGAWKPPHEIPYPPDVFDGRRIDSVFLSRLRFHPFSIYVEMSGADNAPFNAFRTMHVGRDSSGNDQNVCITVYPRNIGECNGHFVVYAASTWGTPYPHPAGATVGETVNLKSRTYLFDVVFDRATFGVALKRISDAFAFYAMHQNWLSLPEPPMNPKPEFAPAISMKHDNVSTGTGTSEPPAQAQRDEIDSRRNTIAEERADIAEQDVAGLLKPVTDALGMFAQGISTRLKDLNAKLRRSRHE